MNYTLPNGAVLSGPTDAVVGALKDMGIHVATYNSSSHGIIPVADMNEVHLGNAVKKAYRRNSLATIDFNPLVDELVRRAQ